MVRILIADDHRLFREGLRSLLGREPTFEVVGEAANGREALARAREMAPDIVLMDMAMPGLNGVEAIRRLREEQPRCRVLAVSMHSSHSYVLRALQAGAAGYVLKDAAYLELTRAIHSVLHGGVYLSPEVAGELVEEHLQHLAAHHPPRETLTPREREVLQLMAEGAGTREIAKMLGVSVKTVETHRRNIMHKLDLHSVAELTKFAVREGLTSLE
jgi:DNA-binding NarL/FixJ family response regulator